MHHTIPDTLNWTKTETEQLACPWVVVDSRFRILIPWNGTSDKFRDCSSYTPTVTFQMTPSSYCIIKTSRNKCISFSVVSTSLSSDRSRATILQNPDYHSVCWPCFTHSISFRPTFKTMWNSPKEWVHPSLALGSYQLFSSHIKSDIWHFEDNYPKHCHGRGLF